jgi:hypothetical protein
MSTWQLPLQWPAAESAAPRRTERLLKAGLVGALLALTLLDRFGLRVSDAFSVPPALLALYGLVALMLASGAAELNPRAALGYLAVACVAGASFVVNASLGAAQYVSLQSLLLLMAVYAPLVFTLREGTAGPGLWRWLVQAYIGFALCLAVFGIAQFFAQFVVRPAWLFDYTPLIPAPIRGSGVWNTVNPAGDWIKSNGFFLREASALSFEMAFALLCELSLSRRKWVMALLGAALVLTYSGSGLLALAVALLFPLGRRTLLQLLTAAALAAAVFFLLRDPLNLEYTAGRVDEFASNRSSAYCRFIEPGVVVLGQIDAHPWASLLGHGPGTLHKMNDTCETTFAKAPFEYGLLGVLALAALVLGALNRSRAPLRLRVALAVKWVLLGGLLAPEPILVIFILSALWPPGAAAAALPRGRGA